MVRTIKRQLVKRSLELLKDIAARPSEDPRGDYSKRCFAPHDTAACPVCCAQPNKTKCWPKAVSGRCLCGLPSRCRIKPDLEECARQLPPLLKCSSGTCVAYILPRGC